MWTPAGSRSPISPLVDDADRERRNDDSQRYAVVDLVSGETAEKTIYLERVQAIVDRELLVMNAEGNCLADVNLSVLEMRAGPKDWQTWSEQRFGKLPKQSTDAGTNARRAVNSSGTSPAA